MYYIKLISTTHPAFVRSALNCDGYYVVNFTEDKNEACFYSYEQAMSINEFIKVNLGLESNIVFQKKKGI